LVLKELLKKCEEIIETKISKIILCVPSYGVEFIIGEGYTTINREENKVVGEDILRALQASAYNKIPSNKELISLMPLEFKLDDETVVNDPKGKTCNKLNVKSLISLVPKKTTFGILSVLESLGITAVDLCFNTMADYYEFRNDNNKDKLGAVINIGSEKTEVGIINKGILVAVDTLFYGGKNIDRDISYIYNISRSDAKRLKERFALAHKANASTSETEEVLTKDNETIKVNQYEISEIVYSRIKEILDFSKKQINILTKREISYIIITGGTTEISDFQKVLDESFNKNVVLQTVTEVGVRNNKYSSVLGFIKYYHSKLNFRSKLATTLTEEEQSGLFVKKKKINDSNLLGKIYGYFFDN
jgi:cell division protein FtsA